MKRIYVIIISLLTLFIFAVTACDDKLPNEYLDEIVIPEKNVSYNEYIQPVLNVKCATSGCHDDGTRAGDYSVTNWANVVTPGIVNPGNVETSRLVWRIEGLGVAIMPPMNNTVVKPLTLNQVKGIKTWIKEGAKNN